MPILAFLGLSVLELGLMYATDRQTSNARQKHRLMPLPYGGGGIISNRNCDYILQLYDVEDCINMQVTITVLLVCYIHMCHILTAEGGLMRTLYGTAAALLVSPDVVDKAAVEPLLGTTVTNWPGMDDVFGSDSTVTLAGGDRAVKLAVCPAAANGLALMMATGACDGDRLTPAGRTVTILRELAAQLGTVTAGPTRRVG